MEIRTRKHARYFSDAIVGVLTNLLQMDVVVVWEDYNQVDGVLLHSKKVQFN